MFDIQTAPDGGIQLSGRFDASQVDKANGVFQALQEGRVVDFARLDYISSAGLGVLLACQKNLRAKGQGLKLINLNAHIRDVLHFSGFDQIFEIG